MVFGLANVVLGAYDQEPAKGVAAEAVQLAFESLAALARTAVG